MWYDIEKHAENAMKGAETSICSAEQATLDPLWDGKLFAVQQQKSLTPSHVHESLRPRAPGLS